MQIAADIFRAYDVRGIVGEQIDEPALHAIGHSIATLHPDVARIAVGRDGRLSSERFADALCIGLRASGADVLDIGEVPTPALYFAACEHCSGSGLMITGSHNPPDYNGVKMMISGHTLAGDDVQNLRRLIETETFSIGHGNYEHRPLLDDYVAAITADVKLARPMRIAVDCGNGVAGPCAQQLFKRLGCETRCLYCDVDGHFPNHHPNPGAVENLADLIAVVRRDQLDLGLAFDGDGDRLGVVDEQGTIIWPDRQMMVYAKDLLRRNPGAGVIYDVKSSRHLADVVTRCGGKPMMSRTGHSFIKAKLRETGALLAGEMSGHIFFNDRWPGFDDGLYAAARLLEIIAADGRRCSELFAELPQAVSTPELNINFESEGRQHEFIEHFAEIARFDGAEVSRLDGVRADFDDGWGLVRASNTTPCLVLRFEADNENRLVQLQQLFRNELIKVDPSLQLPF